MTRRILAIVVNTSILLGVLLVCCIVGINIAMVEEFLR